MKSDKEIEAEVAKLREMKPFVRKHSAFGDDNHERIDAQIRVLDQRMDNDDIYDHWDNDQDIASCASDALTWMEGDEDEPPSEGWAAIDSRNAKKGK